MKIVLKHLEEFNKVLENYQPDSGTLNLLESIPLGIFLGVSGSGRNAIIDKLVASGGYHFIVSDTTRPPKLRNGTMEQDGVQYNFRREENVLQDLRDGKFLEAEVIHGQQVSGISIRELLRAQKSGKIPLNEVDVLGTVNIRKVKPDTVFLFILPPSYDVWMNRLLGREKMDDTELANRKATAIRVLKEAFVHDDWHFIINDNLDDAASEVDGIMRQQSKHSEDSEARRVAQGILDRLMS